MSSTRLDVLECFALVASTGSISEASRQLGMSQPTLSRRISTLEETIGVKLLIREADGVALTEVGRRFLAQLTPLVDRLGNLMTQMSSINERLDGCISILALSTYGETVMMPRILKFRQQYPEIHFNIEFLKEADILENLRNGRGDLGVVTSVPDGEWLRVHRIHEERVVLVTNFDNPNNISTVHEFEKAKFVIYRTGDPLFELFVRQYFRAVHRNRLVMPMTVNSHRSMIETLKHSDMYAVLPIASVANELSNHLLRVASVHELQGGIFMGHRSDVPLTRRGKLFLEYLMTHRDVSI